MQDARGTGGVVSSRPASDGWLNWVLLGVVALSWIPQLGILNRALSYGDEGIIANGALRILRGEVPYRDFFEFITPGSLYWVALFFKVLGPSFFALRAAAWTTSLALLCAVVLSGRLLGLRGRWALLPPAVLAYFGGPAWFIASHHWLATAATAWSFALLLSWAKAGRETSKLLGAGLFAGLTVFALQDHGLLWCFASTAVLLVVAGKGRWRSIGVYWAGSAAVLVPSLLYLTLKAGARTLWYDLFQYALQQYYTMKENKEALLPHVRRTWGALVATLSYHSNFVDWLRIGSAGLIFACMIGIFLLPFFGAWSWLRLGRTVGWRDPTLMISGALFWALYLESLRRLSDTSLVFASAGGILLVAWALQDASRVAGKGRMGKVTWACITLLGLAQLSNAMLAGMEPKAFVQTRAGLVANARAGDQETLAGVAAFAKARWEPEEKVLCFSYAPLFYFLFDLRNPTPWDILTYPQNTQAQLDGAQQILEREETRWILWDRSPVENDSLGRYIASHYKPVAEFTYAAVLERRSDRPGGRVPAGGAP